LPPVVKGDENIFPTIFNVIKTNIPQSEIGAVYHWDGFGRLFEKSKVDFDRRGSTESETVEIASEYIISKKPLFTFVHLDHVDGAGHKYGHGSQEYYNSVAIADKLIGKIFEASKTAGTFESTLFIVTSDHGGIGYGHGGETIDEIEIPFILFGNGIKNGYKILQPVYTYDNAATVAFALNIQQPYAWIGRAVKSAFEGYSEPKIDYLPVNIKPPVIYPARNFYEPAGGLFVDVGPVVRIETNERDVQIRFTIDGTEPDINSSLYEKEFTLKNSAVVQAKVFNNQKEQSIVASAFFRVAKSNSVNGIMYKYFEGTNWKFLPAFESINHIKEGKTQEFRIGKLNIKDENFGFVFESYIKIENEGEYKFYTNSDDGSKLFINDVEIVDNDGDHGTIERSGKIHLTKGFHKINVRYFNGGGGAWLDVYFRGPGIPKQIIPPDVLFLSKQ